MKTLTRPDIDEGLALPRFASCIKHGHYGVPHDARTGCPACRRLAQSLTHLGLSNAIDCPVAERAAWKVVWAAFAVLAVLVGSFLAIVWQANRHLDQAVQRIERASR